ncbi:hypothetical protein SERLADRAFT_441829 [Serpula lacrymans var. lacrymans S7.9]|uniref:DUF6830 domain-containing protein n=1 Tax=Serpula lacrymans var. lacrymans (strain S7.9) TaxID=578457 RepID=F8P7T1_SERL9|nr:uncharacterized protein SERLADRAFT_441829 [Serpula lacrymans var. lacrymans S7.9]EGO20489.1 hypothetical protein SERLADRAFT_441829 [Serpula lacrymans var. lacrymans S7.9]
MVSSLQEFHCKKQAVLDAGGHHGTKGNILNHFQIPKLKLFQHFASSIKSMGSLLQYTADVTERLLLTHCKRLFLATNHKDYGEQMVCVWGTNGLCTQYARNESFIPPPFGSARTWGQSEVSPENAWLHHILPSEKPMHGPRPIRNHFLKGILSDDSTCTFHVNVSASIPIISVDNAAHQFGLDDLRPALADVRFLYPMPS